MLFTLGNQISLSSTYLLETNDGKQIESNTPNEM